MDSVVANHISLMITVINDTGSDRIQCKRYQTHIQTVSSAFFSFHGIWEKKKTTYQGLPFNMTTPLSLFLFIELIQTLVKLIHLVFAFCQVRRHTTQYYRHLSHDFWHVSFILSNKCQVLNATSITTSL